MVNTTCTLSQSYHVCFISLYFSFVFSFLLICQSWGFKKEGRRYCLAPLAMPDDAASRHGYRMLTELYLFMLYLKSCCCNLQKTWSPPGKELEIVLEKQLSQKSSCISLLLLSLSGITELAHTVSLLYQKLSRVLSWCLSLGIKVTSESIQNEIWTHKGQFIC